MSSKRRMFVGVVVLAAYLAGSLTLFFVVDEPDITFAFQTVTTSVVIAVLVGRHVRSRT